MELHALEENETLSVLLAVHVHHNVNALITRTTNALVLIFFTRNWLMVIYFEFFIIQYNYYKSMYLNLLLLL